MPFNAERAKAEVVSAEDADRKRRVADRGLGKLKPGERRRGQTSGEEVGEVREWQATCFRRGDASFAIGLTRLLETVGLALDGEQLGQAISQSLSVTRMRHRESFRATRRRACSWSPGSNGVDSDRYDFDEYVGGGRIAAAIADLIGIQQLGTSAAAQALLQGIEGIELPSGRPVRALSVATGVTPFRTSCENRF